MRNLRLWVRVAHRTSFRRTLRRRRSGRRRNFVLYRPRFRSTSRGILAADRTCLRHNHNQAGDSLVCLDCLRSNLFYTRQLICRNLNHNCTARVPVLRCLY